ncbi:hypothetical protein UMC2_35721 [[Clostridium] sordellii]|uniref:hypothetical protein n=1 Tax=Paraclostridium sordellii TaxID=1505 RepID=UPI000542134E|nr:hypothetical protein [Paeniclostridium sordellii]CEK34361.1 hypothetical protein UMC2_35721 [[Clostridium] sordellii] [Paeniclostridium sordellii]
MDIKLLDKIEQFRQLKKGDMILVRWSDYYIKHTKGIKPIMIYDIQKIVGNEVICQSKNNHYFNYKLYLEKKSAALEIYKIYLKNRG